MPLFINVFAEGGCLLETEPQGEASVAVTLPDDQAELLARLLVSPEISEALAKLFLAGVMVGDQAARLSPPRRAAISAP
jgi:hypothetical protein